MNFYIDVDRGKIISGWFLLDNPAATPVFLLRADGRELVVHPTIVHPNTVEQGWHETGMVGFSITNQDFRGLNQAVDLSLTEIESGLTFYVRPKPRAYAGLRMFAFELRDGAQSLCTQAFAGAFQMAFPDVHHFGQDTRKVFYQLGYAKSVFSCGAPCMKADDPFMTDPAFRRVALLADPLRLLYDVLVPDLAPDDEAALPRLRERIAALDEEERQSLSEPLTRRLTLLYVDDVLERDAIGQALDELSSFDAIGVEDAIGPFVELTAAVCGVDIALFSVPPQMPPFPLAQALRREPAAMELVGRDLDIYDAAWDAIAESHRARA